MWIYYRELVMEKDQAENAQFFPEGQKTISSEEIQDNVYDANGCIPLGYKVLDHQMSIHQFLVLWQCCPQFV